jgi:hypothetical protein
LAKRHEIKSVQGIGNGPVPGSDARSMGDSARETRRENAMFDFATIRRYVLIGLAGLILLTAILLSFFTVKQYERAVVTTWGKFSYVADPGLGFKIPFVQAAHRIRTASIRAQAEALRQNTGLVELRKAETWNGALPTQMLSGIDRS